LSLANLPASSLSCAGR